MSSGNPELAIIWRILAGTGCRLAEVTGLRIGDVVTGVGLDIPHLIVESHSGRRLKTRSSHRLVPLVGDALDAVREALRNSSPGRRYLFSRYVSRRGSDAASAVLMEHLRMVTNDQGHVVHSLRHSMKDRLRIGDVPREVQDWILGHASGSVGEGYGGSHARLVVAHRHMVRLSGSIDRGMVIGIFDETQHHRAKVLDHESQNRSLCDIPAISWLAQSRDAYTGQNACA